MLIQLREEKGNEWLDAMDFLTNTKMIETVLCKNEDVSCIHDMNQDRDIKNIFCAALLYSLSENTQFLLVDSGGAVSNYCVSRDNHNLVCQYCLLLICTFNTINE